MTRISKVAMAAIVIMAAVACGGSSDATAPMARANINGNWNGSYSYVSGGHTYTTPITMSIVVNNNVVTGTGTFNADTDFGSVETLSGTFNPPNVTIIMHDANTQDVIFAGSANGNTMTGTLNGSGFVSDAIVFTRH